tara:strand:- start:178218 stop:178760 length:543 start_codon:yes stop_codon:yes gene_type:complete
MEEPDTRKLMLRMHRGDELAAQQLWSFVASRLIAYARVTLPSGMGGAAEDVVQSVFLKVLKLPRRSLKDIQDATAYLYRATRNEALNYGRGEVRENARRRALEVQEQTPQDNRVEPMLTAMERLPADQQDVISLRYLGGLSIDQVAQVLDLNRNTVARRSRLGMNKLRDELSMAEYGDAQ